MGKKLSKGDRGPAWTNKKLLTKFKLKQEVYRRWKQ